MAAYVGLQEVASRVHQFDVTDITSVTVLEYRRVEQSADVSQSVYSAERALQASKSLAAATVM